MKKMMSLQKKHQIHDQLLKHRLDTLIKPLMEETDIDMWIIIGDEYNEGPTLKTLLPSTFFHARRQSIIIFYNNGNSIEKMIVSKPDFTIADFYTPVLLKPPNFDFEKFYSTFASTYDLDVIRKLPIEDKYTCINRIIKEKNPNQIGLEYSSESAFSDGLSHTHYTELLKHLDSNLHNKIISSEFLSIRWLETRTDLEMIYMKQIVDKTREIIKTCYSREVIKPGQSTIGDARFYLMETATSIGMTPWFDATVWLKRKGRSHIDNDAEIIQEGDLIHCDFGVKYLGLCSDVQEMAYVKGTDDEELIESYKTLHTSCRQLQDIVTSEFKAGLTGNEILKNALKSAENIEGPIVFTHPIGFYGHGPGPTIGLFSNQTFVENSGEFKLHNGTCFALELCVRQFVPVLETTILYGQEIDIIFKDGIVTYFSGRQDKLHII